MIWFGLVFLFTYFIAEAYNRSGIFWGFVSIALTFIGGMLVDTLISGFISALACAFMMFLLELKSPPR